MALSFAEHADVVYDNAPLTNVLSQIKFSPIFSLGAAAGIAGFQGALRSLYPVALPAQQRASVQVAPIPAMDIGAPIWRFSDESGVWTVGIAVDFVSLDTTAYTSIDEFLSRLDRVLVVLNRTLRPSSTTRIGLRKVNVILAPVADEPSSFSSVVRPELLGALAVKEWPAPLAGGASQLQFQEDEYTSMVVRSGIGRDESGILGLALDMDYFTDRPFQIDGGGDLTELLKHFSDGMTSFFEWSLLQQYKDTLGPRPRSANGARD